MTAFFDAYSKPMITTSSSVYYPIIKDSSRLLLNLYLYTKNIVKSLEESPNEKLVLICFDID